MNRHTYQKLRHAARRAQRAWWNAIKDSHATTYDRDHARDVMHETAAAVPGGMSYGAPGVMLDGWFWRRAAVSRRIADRKAKARIAEAVELMASGFSQSEWRWAA